MPATSRPREEGAGAAVFGAATREAGAQAPRRTRVKQGIPGSRQEAMNSFYRAHRGERGRSLVAAARERSTPLDNGEDPALTRLAPMPTVLDHADECRRGQAFTCALLAACGGGSPNQVSGS